MDSGSSSKRTKLVSAVVAVTLLMAVGVVALNSNKNILSAEAMDSEHAQAMAKIQGAKTPLLNLPEEWEVATPVGWEIESDEPVEDTTSDEQEESVSEDGDDLEQDLIGEDDDIDSPMQVEEDETGRQFVAELDSKVIVTPAEAEENGNKELVGADGRGYNRCFKNLKRCNAKRVCTRKCTKKCRPYAVRTCKRKKFCRCFCKYKRNNRQARKCVVYKKKVCKQGRQYRCKRRCKKFCKKVPHCYCCPLTRVRKHCRKLCKQIMYKSKCSRCRCRKLKCYNTCRFVCVKK